jgi:hypothetical protein
LATFGLFGAKECEAHELRLDAQFAQYEVVMKEIAKEMSIKKRPKDGAMANFCTFC